MADDRTLQEMRDDRRLMQQIADKVNGIAVTQATQITKSDAMHTDVRKINGRVTTVEIKVDSLESTRDKNIGKSKGSASIKKTVAWTVVIMGTIGGLIFGTIRMFL